MPQVDDSRSVERADAARFVVASFAQNNFPGDCASLGQCRSQIGDVAGPEVFNFILAITPG